MRGDRSKTDDDNGALAFWDSTDGLTEPIEVEFMGRRWPPEARDGAFFSVWTSSTRAIGSIQSGPRKPLAPTSTGVNAVLRDARRQSCESWCR
jgi:hypothetical protein